MSTAISRRSFLKASALAGGGLMIVFNGIDKAIAGVTPGEALFEPNAFIKISKEGIITIMAPNPEVGQGVKTSLPMLVAEELDVDWEQIIVEQAPLDTVKYTRQVAGGSGSIKASWESFRKAGAVARYMLREAAAQQWKVNTSECKTENSQVVHIPTGRKLSYGELSTGAVSVMPPAEIPLKDPKDYKIIGKRIRSVDNKKIVTGKPLYGIDNRREGMLYAMVARPPAFGKKLKSYDDSAARAVSGVKNVVSFDNKVAVLAASTWAAKKGRDALKIEWEDEVTLENTSDHQEALKKLIQEKHPEPKRNNGDIEKSLSGAKKVLELTFEAPFLPHASMEPLNFFADVREDKVEVYGSIQTPARARGAISKELNIPEEKITVGMSPRMGGGFGRRLQADYAVEAAKISYHAKAPVQVIWTREDDMQGGFYRPAGMYRYRAAINQDGELDGWYLIAAGVNQGNATRENSFPAGAVPNFRIDSHEMKSAITTGPWRAPNHNFLAFTEESFIDEIARELKKDPIAFRLELLERARGKQYGEVIYDVDRYKEVLRQAAEFGKWYTHKQGENGIYKGFGAHYSFNSYVAQIADISIQNGKVKVHKVYCVSDCGRVINYSGAENQIEGGIIDGLGHALYGELLFEKGEAVQKNFNTYKLMRLPDAPEIEVKFVENNLEPTGLGEPGLPPTAAALANAVYNATGQRVTRLPFSLSQFAL